MAEVLAVGTGDWYGVWGVLCLLAAMRVPWESLEAVGGL